MRVKFTQRVLPSVIKYSSWEHKLEIEKFILARRAGKHNIDYFR